MLEDRTNTLEAIYPPAAGKVFQRRSKAEKERAAQLVQTHAAPAPQDPFLQQGQPGTVAKTPDTDSSSGSHGSASSDDYNWLGLSQGRRRSSMLLPGGLRCLAKELAAVQSKQRLQHEARNARLLAILNEMAGYYAEVDAFELVEESPEPIKAKKSMPRRGKLPGKGHAEKALQHQPSSSPAEDGAASTPPCKGPPQTISSSRGPDSTVSLQSLKSSTPPTAAPAPVTHTSCARPSWNSPVPGLASHLTSVRELSCSKVVSAEEDPLSSLAVTASLSPRLGLASLLEEEQQSSSCLETIDPSTGEDQDSQRPDSQTALDLHQHRPSLGQLPRSSSHTQLGAVCEVSHMQNRSMPMPPPQDQPSTESSTYQTHRSTEQRCTAGKELPRSQAEARRTSAPSHAVPSQPIALPHTRRSSTAVVTGRRTSTLVPLRLACSQPGTDFATKNLPPLASSQQPVDDCQADVTAAPARHSIGVAAAQLACHMNDSSQIAVGRYGATGAVRDLQGDSAASQAQDNTRSIGPQHEQAAPEVSQSLHLEASQLEAAVEPATSSAASPKAVQPVTEVAQGSQPLLSEAQEGQQESDSVEALGGKEEQGCGQAQEPTLSPMQELLRICGQSTDEAAIPSMSQFIGNLADLRKITKIGEGTYGEAFKFGKIVFKVVPVEGTAMVNNAPQKRAHEMAAEAVIALTLTGLRRPSDAAGQPAVNQSSCFVETHQVGVCRGPYAKELVRAWHKWDKAHGSENDPVDGLQPSQLYLVIAMADCGRDLEKAAVPGFDQARSLLAQVAMALAVGEEALEFEHRDLHWGNVMVQAAASPTINFRLKGQDIKVDTHGMTAALIDFTASRLRTLTGKLAYCNLSSDPELFEGPKGEVQFDTYRWMRRLNGDDWEASCLGTNCLWLAYLAEMMLSSKGINMTTAQKRKLREFRRRAAQSPSCGLLISDDFFSGLWRPTS